MIENHLLSDPSMVKLLTAKLLHTIKLSLLVLRIAVATVINIELLTHWPFKFVQKHKNPQGNFSAYAPLSFSFVHPYPFFTVYFNSAQTGVINLCWLFSSYILQLLRMIINLYISISQFRAQGI